MCAKKTTLRTARKNKKKKLVNYICTNKSKLVPYRKNRKGNPEKQILDKTTMGLKTLNTPNKLYN